MGLNSIFGRHEIFFSVDYCSDSLLGILSGV